MSLPPKRRPRYKNWHSAARAPNQRVRLYSNGNPCPFDGWLADNASRVRLPFCRVIAQFRRGNRESRRATQGGSMGSGWRRGRACEVKSRPKEPRQPATGLSFQHEAPRRLKARSSIRNNSLPPSEGRQSLRPCKPWRSAASESVSQKRDCVLKALADILGSDERFTNSGNYWKHSAIITEISII